MLPPDHGSRTWHTAQVERVLDCLDVATLRKAAQGYDVRFKTRIWNVSQNIDYSKDTQHFGILGCITPTGMLFVSDSWRAMTAKESLVLQGIPLHKISLTVETDAQIQDLAGNAMSGPLVGAAILSSLIAGHKVFASLPVNTLDEETQTRKQEMPNLVTADMQTASMDGGDHEINVPCLHQEAKRALRLCYCEGAHGLSKQRIQQCTDCGHTTCLACGGNPEHSYRVPQKLSIGRIPMAAFEEDLRNRLPLQLKLANIPNLGAQGISADHHERIISLASSTFFLSNFCRSHCIRILYTAVGGWLELWLSEGTATGYLFAEAPTHLPANDSIRETLAQPVAKANIGDSLLASSWQWRSLSESAAKISIAGGGKEMPTWWARMQMPDFREHWQWQALKVNTAAAIGSEINGTYQYLPRCGTACESLYKRVEPDEELAVYLFLDPTRVGPAEQDCFVFARSHAMLDYDETRHVLARVDPTWRP